MRKILCIVTGGLGDAYRARRLLNAVDAEVTSYIIDKSRPRSYSGREIWKLINSANWDLIFQEGSGVAGGLNLIRAALLKKAKYVVSSGDPVSGFFHTTQGHLMGSSIYLYESALYRNCSGFVGWTPYLTGRALKMGARRAITVEGAVDLDEFISYNDTDRILAKHSFGLNPEHLVCGVSGSLVWNKRQQYCYGLEIIESLKLSRREDIAVLVVGDGSGRIELERRIPENLRSRVVFTGRLERSEVVRALNAMNIGFIAQTLDGLGSYRLTTKLPEYLATELPVAMSPIPGFFDYVYPAGWPLPAYHPGSKDFHTRCARWLDSLEFSDVKEKASHAREIARRHFDYDVLAKRFAVFLEEIIFKS